MYFRSGREEVELADESELCLIGVGMVWLSASASVSASLLLRILARELFLLE